MRFVPKGHTQPKALYFKPGLHIVVTVTEPDCSDALKRILKLSIYPLQLLFVKHKYL